ncbi:MAG: hypothetical protein EA385_05010 [Salinarimonadaceae bacterium]|nr:MAG: hypothetical protein EA385_05010 [Salinarimonadaceae bacterium]
MIFALVLIPLIIGVGAAVDYGRAILERSKLQRGLDQAALTLVRKIKTMSDAEAAAQARLIIAPELSESVNIAGRL